MENAIIRTLFESTALFTVLFAGVWLTKLLFKKQLSAVMHYLLWGIVILKLLVPVGLPSTMSPLNLLGGSPPAMTRSIDPVNAMNDTITNRTGTPTGQNTAIQYAPPVTPVEQTTADTAQLQSPTVQAPFTITWETAVTGVWLAGMAGMGVWLAISAIRMRRKMAMNDTGNIPGKVHILFLQCKRELGIKRKIRLSVQNAFPMPAITGLFRPVLILPADTAKAHDDDQLRHIMMHELNHYKHGDLAVIWILNILNAVYWFNPLVWLCIRLMRKDMETVCDTAVLRRLGRGSRQAYISTILQFAEKNGGERLQAALSINDERIQMKKRIEGMFMKKRTKHSVRIAAILLCGLMAFTCFTTACQPTPATPAVVNKNTDLVGEVAKANEEGNKAELAKDKQVINEQIQKLNGHLNMEFKPNAQVTIKVDADITPVGDRKYPVIREQPENFTKEQFDTFVKYLTNDQPLFYMADGSHWTKEEIGAMLPHVKGYGEQGNLPSYIKSTIKDVTGRLEEDFTSAPSKADEKPYDGTLIQKDNNKYYSTITQLKCYLGKDQAAHLSLRQSFNKTKTSLQFDNDDYGIAYATFEPYTGTDAKQMKLTYQEAKAKAEEFVKQMDGQDSSMVIYDSAIAYQSAFGYHDKETAQQAYAFNFARSYNGIPVEPIGYLTTASEKIDYSKQIRPEGIFIIIDDKGINTASWQNHTKFMEKAAEDTPMIDFDSVKDIFEQHCKQKFTWVPRDDALQTGPTKKDLRATLNINRVELNLMVMPEKDNLDNYITVPVWDFIGDMNYDEKYISQEGSTAEGEKNISIVTINAINGSIIDREQGY